MLSDPLVVPMLLGDNLLSIHDSSVFSDLSELVNPVNIGATCIALHTIGQGDGNSKRTASYLGGQSHLTQTIAHSKSKENAPFETVRTMQRYDDRRINAVTGKPVTMSAYAVLAVPQSDTFNRLDARRLMEALALFILLGGQYNLASAAPWGDLTSSATLDRLLDGEA